MFARLSKRPWIIAVVIAVLLLAWLFSGDRFVARDDVEPDQPATTNDLARVEIQWLEAQPMQRQHVVQGQIEAWRRVELRAQVSGSVQNLDQDKGSRVAADQLLLSISPDDRPAQVARSEADVRQRQSDVTAAKRLRERSLVSANELMRLESELPRPAPNSTAPVCSSATPRSRRRLPASMTSAWSNWAISSSPARAC